MDLSRIVKWLVLLVFLFVVWKYVVPWVKEEAGRGRTTSARAGGGDSSCVSSADRASAAWGGGLGRFVNPPYDVEAWSNFRTEVEAKINIADEACGCAEEPCQKVRGAMRDLRGLIGELDASIRNGSNIEQDIVRRMEAIDREIDEARDLAKGGK